MGKSNVKFNKGRESWLYALSKFSRISDTLKRAIETELEYQVLPRHSFILQPPLISDTLYYMHSGFAMSYVLMEGRKLTKAFWKPGQLVVSFYSMFNQTPTNEHIQVVEKAEVAALKYSSLKQIIAASQEAQALYYKIMNDHYLQGMNEIDDIQMMTAIERFQKLLAIYPNLEQLVSQEAIAHYLSITPQSLSRLKRQHG